MMLKFIPESLWNSRPDLFPCTHWEFIRVVVKGNSCWVVVKYYEFGVPNND